MTGVTVLFEEKGKGWVNYAKSRDGKKRLYEQKLFLCKNVTK